MNESHAPCAMASARPLPSAWQSVAVALLTLLAVALAYWSGFDVPGGAMDEGMLLTYPDLVLKGKLPYRDFETFYGPGNLWVLAASYAPFGVQVEVERSVGLLYRLVILAGIFVLLCRWTLTGAVMGTLIAATILYPCRLPAYAWFGAVGCILWAIVLLGGGLDRRRVTGAGLLTGAALLFRVDLGLAAVASIAPFFLLWTPRLRVTFLTAVAVALSPLAVLAVWAGLGVTFQNLFIYPVFVTNAARRLSLLDAPDVIFFFLLHLVACICLLLAGGLACARERRSLPARLVLAAALLATGLTHQAVQRADEIHVFVTIFLSLALLPLGLAILLRGGDIRRLPMKWTLPPAFALLAIIALRAPALPLAITRSVLHSLDPDAPQVPSVIVRDRSFPRPNLVAQSQQIADYLEAHSKPGERLFVGTGDMRFTVYNDNFFYYLLPWLTPATYYLEFNPLSANRPGSRLASDIATADWVIVNRIWDEPTEKNQSRIPGSDAPNAVIRTQFEAQIIVDPLAIFRRRQPRVAGEDDGRSAP
jgi:hypothetical protein